MRNYGYYLDVRGRGISYSSATGSKACSRRGDRTGNRRFFAREGVTHIMINRAPLDDPRRGLSPDARARFNDFLARAASLSSRGALMRYLSYLSPSIKGITGNPPKAPLFQRGVFKARSTFVPPFLKGGLGGIYLLP